MNEHRTGGLERAGATLSAAGFCIGIPALLCRAAGWPLPRRLPSLSTVGAAFNGRWRPDDHFVISVLAVVAWVVWAQIAATAIVELRAIRSGRRAGTLPFSSWCRPIAIRIAATLAVVAPFTPRSAGAVPLPRPTPVTVTMPAVGPWKRRSSPRRLRPPLTLPRPTTTYVVRADDTLWDLAQTHLGDPLRWREIYDLNRGRLQPDGRRLEDAGLLRPRWQLILPVAVPTAAAPERADSDARRDRRSPSKPAVPPTPRRLSRRLTPPPLRRERRAPPRRRHRLLAQRNLPSRSQPPPAAGL